MPGLNMNIKLKAAFITFGVLCLVGVWLMLVIYWPPIIVVTTTFATIIFFIRTIYIIALDVLKNGS